MEEKRLTAESGQINSIALQSLQEPLARIVTVVLGLDPWHESARIVESTARKYNADVSTLFQVRGNRLIAKGGYVLVDDKELAAPPPNSYELDWDATTWEDLKKQGITPGVAIFNRAVEYNSYVELCANHAHLGQWDPQVYPHDTADDPVRGFGCMYAVPLRLRDTGIAKNTVLGVFKIERRRVRPVFTEIERAAFANAADHVNQNLRLASRLKIRIDEHVANILQTEPLITYEELERRRHILSRYDEVLQDLAWESPITRVVERLSKELPEAERWINTAVERYQGDLNYQSDKRRISRLPTVVAALKTESIINPLLKQTRAGLAGKAVSPEVSENALRNLERWLDSPAFSAYRAQLDWLIKSQKWDVVLDSFYRVLPFGTGGRRGPVGIGTNRFNPFTLLSSVRGHVDFLRKRHPDKDLSIVLAYDVRAFHDIRKIYNRKLENPLTGITSRTFAHLAAGVYAANTVRVYMLPHDSKSYIPTPELSFLIRELHTQGGLNISASHNHPDDNGGKFFNEHGGQEVPPQDEEMAKEVEGVDDFTSLTIAEAKEAGYLLPIPAELHQEYIDLNLKQSLDSSARGSRVVFTPLHGTGDKNVGEVLRQAGFEVEPVPSQSKPDGTFAGVPFRAPNPEVRESMDAGIEVAKTVSADLVMACDPDADRIGICSATASGAYRFLTGNEIAALVTHYKLDMLRSLKRLPARPLMIKTEVTTDLLRAIAADFGARLVGDLLVGFKYHADVLRQLETNGRYQGIEGDLDDFVIAVEESHGILVTHRLRDKDAAGAAILIAELAARLRAQNRTLADYLNDLYLRYGYHANYVTSMVMSGAEGSSNIDRIQSSLRQHPPHTISDYAVTEVIDHQALDVRGPKLSETDWDARNVLVFKLDKIARVIVRPSGTEPKNKTYVEVRSGPLGMGVDKEALARNKVDTDAIAQRIADDFTRQMLSIIGMELPNYALRISGLVPLDRRISFVQEFMPELERRIKAIWRKEVTEEKVSKWISDNLRGYGEDARGLVADAIEMYVATERIKTTRLEKNEKDERLRSLDRLCAFFSRDKPTRVA